jgi:hypothetical protein
VLGARGEEEGDDGGVGEGGDVAEVLRVRVARRDLAQDPAAGPNVVVKRWSNAGQTLVNAGECEDAPPGPVAAGLAQYVVEYWSNTDQSTGQTAEGARHDAGLGRGVVERWSNTHGQPLVKILVKLRKAHRMILPLRVLGRPGTKWTTSGCGQELVKCWSNAGQMRVECGSWAGRALCGRGGPDAGGQTTVTYWSNTGQILVKYWSWVQG